MRLPREAERGTRAATSGRSSAEVEAAVRRAVADVTFGFELVLRLNVKTAERAEREALVGALVSALLLIASEREGRWPAQHEERHGAPAALALGAAWLSRLYSFDRAIRDVEARYLAGHGALFPDIAAAWRTASPMRSGRSSAAFSSSGSTNRRARCSSYRHRRRTRTRVAAMLRTSWMGRAPGPDPARRGSGGDASRAALAAAHARTGFLVGRAGRVDLAARPPSLLRTRFAVSVGRSADRTISRSAAAGASWCSGERSLPGVSGAARIPCVPPGGRPASRSPGPSQRVRPRGRGPRRRARRRLSHGAEYRGAEPLVRARHLAQPRLEPLARRGKASCAVRSGSGVCLRMKTSWAMAAISEASMRMGCGLQRSTSWSHLLDIS